MSQGKKREEKPLVIKISEDDWNKIRAYCRAASPMEIMGLAEAEIGQGGVINVENPFILKQTVTGSTCEFENGDFARWIGTSETVGRTKVFWHSHVNFSAFFSGTDRETSLRMARLGGGENRWFVSIVVNLKGEYEAVVDVFHPFEACLPAKVIIVPAKQDEIKKEVKDKLVQPAPTPRMGSIYTTSELFQGVQHKTHSNDYFTSTKEEREENADSFMDDIGDNELFSDEN